MSKIPWQSGFCSAGLHEGMKPKGFLSGTPMKVCVFVDKCKCKCHAELDMMFQMVGLPRLPQQNPEYVPYKADYIMPTPEERAARFTAKDIVPPKVLESPLPDRVPVTIERSYAPTNSGRAARGQLELWVKKECDQWLVDKVEESCTPAYLSLQIAARYGVKEPSVGAVNAVFERWSLLGYAFIVKKPTRFIGYMPDGVKYGLEGLKERHKRMKNQGAVR